MSRVIQWSGGRTPAAAANDVRSAAVPSLLLLLFWILEGVQNDISVTAGFLLFLALLWFVQVAFYVAITPVVRFVRDAQATMTPASASIRIIAAVSLLALWTGLVVDHLPSA